MQINKALMSGIDIGDRKTRSPHQGVTKIGKPVTVSENVKKIFLLLVVFVLINLLAIFIYKS